MARVAAVLGHELRNPLAAAVTGTALARELVDAGDPRRPVLDGVARDLQRLVELVDGWLQLARCGRPRRDRVAMGAVCAEIAATRPGVSAAVRGAPEVTGDGALLRRAIENLVDNALQAGAGRVQVAVAEHGERVRVTVDDDGPGVPPELRARIFEPGFSRNGGSGLGLGIVAETVAVHGGRLRCEPGARGARFVFELPAGAVAASA